MEILNKTELIFLPLKMVKKHSIERKKVPIPKTKKY